VQGEFTAGPTRAALTDLLGFFGGDALGISQAWIVAPAVIVFAIAAASAIDRREPGKPVHLLLLMLSGPAFMALAGFATPRSFLYLAPVVAGLMIMFGDQQLRGAHPGRLLAAVALFLAACVSRDCQHQFRNASFQAQFGHPLSSHIRFHPDKCQRQLSRDID